MLSLVAVVRDVFQVHGDFQRLGLARSKKSGLGVANQLDGQLLCACFRIVRRLAVDLNDLLAGSVAGVGDGSGNGHCLHSSGAL